MVKLEQDHTAAGPAKDFAALALEIGARAVGVAVQTLRAVQQELESLSSRVAGKPATAPHNAEDTAASKRGD
jgi:hypothetical protein